MDFTLLSTYIDHRLLIAAGLGAIIGMEREFAGKDPSFRTFALICLGSCVFSIISNSLVLPLSPEAAADPFQARYLSDPGRIAAQVVVGIGFLGAGTIFRSKHGVSGLTTAALMWVTAAIGMAVGFDKLDLAITGTVTAIIILVVLTWAHKIVNYIRSRNGEPSPGLPDE
ncbi:MAG: MgtC/SapB family protein [Deltaproteobacteria bacterium]|nr:MgtC/SapB family protein [Deltaproteobacteria bacterium]